MLSYLEKNKSTNQKFLKQNIQALRSKLFTTTVARRVVPDQKYL